MPSGIRSHGKKEGDEACLWQRQAGSHQPSEPTISIFCNDGISLRYGSHGTHKIHLKSSGYSGLGGQEGWKRVKQPGEK